MPQRLRPRLVSGSKYLLVQDTDGMCELLFDNEGRPTSLIIVIQLNFCCRYQQADFADYDAESTSAIPTVRLAGPSPQPSESDRSTH